jgi:hypothetical protein
MDRVWSHGIMVPQKQQIILTLTANSLCGRALDTLSGMKFQESLFLLTLTSVVYSNAGEDTMWEPVPALNRTDADVHLVFIAPNSLLYDTPVDDPLFSAHLVSNISITDQNGNMVKYYEADYYIGAIGCTDQHQVCNGDVCTKLTSSQQVFSSSLGLSMVQRGIFQRLGFASVFTGVAHIINGRSGTALRASETVLNFNQASLPSNQWQIEVSSWFDTGLATLQAVIREYASPALVSPGLLIRKPETPVGLAMCHSQKTQTMNGTVSFSMLGLGIILVVGSLVILISFVLETAVGWIGLKTHINWMLDDKLQLQRMVFERRGVKWTNREGTIPVTEKGERFASVPRSPETHGLMEQDAEKIVETSVREVQ